jgi:cytosine/adenosine deaminase-related metal-dependent hydrolase
MAKEDISRRSVLAGTTTLGAASLFPKRTLAQAGSAPVSRAADRPAATLPTRGEFVVRGAHVLTMDPAIADLPVGDVHVRDGAIVAVAANVSAPGAEVIDGKGMICMPGFVDTHFHLWTSLLRPVMRQDTPARGYFPVTAKLGPHYTPEDSYRSVRLGLAEALAAGITTTQNWAHNVRSPAHADAEMSAMRDAGMRGRFAYGSPLGDPNDKPMDLADLARAKRDWVGKDGMLTLGICSRNVGNDPNPTRGTVTMEMAKKEWGGARDLGLPITLHTSGPRVTKLLEDNGLLGPDLQLVHPLGLSAEDIATLAKRGVHYSSSPTGELRRTGNNQVAELLQAGIVTSLSIDHNTTYNVDCFVCMRMLYTLNWHNSHKPFRLTTKRLVQLFTIDGAKDLGFADKIGSLTPGKRADLLLLRTTDINMSQIGDAYDAVVALAQPINIDTVVVDGRILRRGNKFTGMDHAKVVADATQSVTALQAKAKWPG